VPLLFLLQLPLLAQFCVLKAPACCCAGPRAAPGAGNAGELWRCIHSPAQHARYSHGISRCAQELAHSVPKCSLLRTSFSDLCWTKSASSEMLEQARMDLLTAMKCVRWGARCCWSLLGEERVLLLRACFSPCLHPCANWSCNLHMLAFCFGFLIVPVVQEEGAGLPNNSLSYSPLPG
jgi:hypothetical protein